MKLLLELRSGEIVRFPEGISVDLVRCAEEEVIVSLFNHEGLLIDRVAPGSEVTTRTVVFALCTNSPVKVLTVE